MAITEQEVFEAAEQVRGEGRTPSAISIREITQTGSLGTIQKHLRKWRHQEVLSASSNNPPPEPVLNSIRQFGEQLWQLALQSAEKAANLKVRQANEELEVARNDAEEALDAMEKQQKNHDGLTRDLQASQKANEQLKNELQLNQDILHKATEKCHQLEGQQSQHLEEIESLHQDLDAAQGTSEELSHSLQQEQDRTRQLIHDQKGLELELQRALKQRDVQDEELKSAQRSAREESLERARIEQRLDSTQGELEASAEKITQQDQNISELMDQIRKLELELQSQKTKVESEQEARLRLEKILQDLKVST